MKRHASSSAQSNSGNLQRRLDIVLAALLISAVVLSFFAIRGMANDPFAGGWEIQGSLSQVEIVGKNDAKTLDASGLHQLSYDVDGNFVPGENHDDPDIIVKTSYPYYVKNTADGWVRSENPAIIDTYRREFDNGSKIYEYVQYAVAIDVQIQTNADKYTKNLVDGYLDYGKFFEANVVDVDVKVTVGLNPWTPRGTSGDYEIVDGWAGIMSASVLSLDYGLLESSATENYGHTLTALHSQGQALNMYESNGSRVGTVNFDDPSALTGIPSSVVAEVSARMGAGAHYVSDWWGHWTDCAVRNVYVSYKVRFDFVSTLVYELAAGHQDDAKPPKENNTAYAPEITPWTQFLEGLEKWFPNFQNVLIVIVVGIVGIAVIVVAIRFGGR
ncbi:MAG: hypothetical protein ACTSX2_06325 [Candidatus Thorarchaeota archaeon]